MHKQSHATQFTSSEEHNEQNVNPEFAERQIKIPFFNLYQMTHDVLKKFVSSNLIKPTKVNKFLSTDLLPLQQNEQMFIEEMMDNKIVFRGNINLGEDAIASAFKYIQAANCMCRISRRWVVAMTKVEDYYETLLSLMQTGNIPLPQAHKIHCILAWCDEFLITQAQTPAQSRCAIQALQGMSLNEALQGMSLNELFELFHAVTSPAIELRQPRTNRVWHEVKAKNSRKKRISNEHEAGSSQ